MRKPVVSLVVCLIAVLGVAPVHATAKRAGAPKYTFGPLDRILSARTRIDRGVYLKRFQTVKADIDGDGRPEFVVLWGEEGMGGCGQCSAESLAVFTGAGSKWRLAANLTVGGQFGDAVDHFVVDGSTITAFGLRWAEADAACCPTIPITRSFLVRLPEIIERF